MMDEILKSLLESNLLSEETKQQISEQFQTAVDTYLSEERAKIEVEVRSNLTEEFVKAREALAESIEKKVDTYIESEFEELKEDINKFRDLEVEYAEKLVEAKEDLAQELGSQLDKLVDKIDAFLEFRLDEEMSELKEDIDEVKKLQFGRKIFEAMEAEFKSFRKEDLTNTESELAEALDKLHDAESRLAEIESKRISEARNSKMEELLAPLSGTAREQMKVILSNVSVEKLDEAFKIYIGRILKESTNKTAEEKNSKLTESIKETSKKYVSGNEEVVEESVKPNDQLSRIRQLAGLNK